MTSFATRLHNAVIQRKTPALVGLDPRFDQLPEPVIEAARQKDFATEAEFRAAAFEEFCRRIIDVVAPLVPAVKPQAAFFEELGPPGCQVLARVIRHARDAGLIVIGDAKRGDIGSTAAAYARAWLAGEDPDAAPWAADALTVNPYLGADTLAPFIDVAKERAAGIYVLVRTSNPGAGVFQDRQATIEGDPTPQPIYRHVATAVEALSAETCDGEEFGCVGAVVGATWPRELTELRAAMPHVPLLVPGYGSQGAGAADVAGGFTAQGLGALVNSSRAINFAHLRAPWDAEFGPQRWEDAVEAATRQMIAELAEQTPAGALVTQSPGTC